eukprot:2338101-Alexandrium_andersonii.AAC.1
MELVRLRHAAGDLVDWRSQTVRTARRPGWADAGTVTIVVHRLTLRGDRAAERLEALLGTVRAHEDLATPPE